MSMKKIICTAVLVQVIKSVVVVVLAVIIDKVVVIINSLCLVVQVKRYNVMQKRQGKHFMMKMRL